MSDPNSDQGDVVHLMTDFLAPADDEFADEMDVSTVYVGDKIPTVVKNTTKTGKSSIKQSKSSTPSAEDTNTKKHSSETKIEKRNTAHGKTTTGSTKRKAVKKKFPVEKTKGDTSSPKSQKEIKHDTTTSTNHNERKNGDPIAKKDKLRSFKKKLASSRKCRTEVTKRRRIQIPKDVEPVNEDLKPEDDEDGLLEDDNEGLLSDDSNENEKFNSREQAPVKQELDGFDTRSEASSSGTGHSGSLDSSQSGEHHGSSRHKRISPIVYENDKLNKIDDQQSKLKYLFRGSRYFLVKSNNHENVALAKAKAVWATPPINENKLGEAYMSCRHVVLIYSVKESGKFQGYARMRTPPVRDGPIVNWVLPTGLSRAALGGTFHLDWITRQEVSFTKTQHLYNPWNDMKPVKIGRDGQEIEPCVGEELCRLFPMDPQIDIVEILREARRRRRDDSFLESSRGRRDSMSRPARQDFRPRLKRSRHGYERRDDYDRPKRRPPPFSDGPRDSMASGSSYSEYLRDFHQSRHPPPMAMSPYGQPHPNSYPSGPMGPPPPHYTQMDRSLPPLSMRDSIRGFRPLPISRRDRDRHQDRDRDRERGRRESHREKDRRSSYDSRSRSSAVDNFLRHTQNIRSRRSRSPLSPPRNRAHRRR